jgi:membrane protein DedA with SNARE-associated domain
MSDDRADRDEAEPVTADSSSTTPESTEPDDDSATTEPDASSEAEPKENPWAAIKPWQGKAAGLDKLLLFIIIGVPLIYLGLMPLRPWMLVNAPVVQEFINGAKTSIVAAAAYARVGEIPLWLVIVAGFVGMAKLDWAFWLAGRRWGDGVLRLFAQNERQLKRINQLKKIPNWALFLMTLISRCPGIPGTLVYIVAGWTRMRLSLFLVADLLGCLIFTLIWTFLGYQLGEAAVDILKVIDKYALWLTLALIVGIFAITFFKEYRKQKKAEAAGETSEN